MLPVILSHPLLLTALWILAIGVSVLAAYLWRRAARLRRELRGSEQSWRERERELVQLVDGLVQNTQGLVIGMQGVVATLPPGSAARPAFESLLGQAESMVQQAREQLQRQPGASVELGVLSQALAQAWAALGTAESVTFQVRVVGHPQRVRSTVVDDVYSLVREALAQAAAHPGLRAAHVTLRYDEEAFMVEIGDEGGEAASHIPGFGQVPPPPRVAQGLMLMHQRAAHVGGRLSFDADAGSGRRVQLSVPAGLAYGEPVRPQLPALGGCAGWRQLRQAWRRRGARRS